MSFVPRTITDEVIEFPNRLLLTDTTTGLPLGIYDYTRIKGVITSNGTPINKAFLDPVDTELKTLGDNLVSEVSRLEDEADTETLRVNTALDTKLAIITYPNIAQQKIGTGTFTAGATSYTVTDAFITASTHVIVNQSSNWENSWHVESFAGNFTIYSRDGGPDEPLIAETDAVTFSWCASKGAV